MTALTKKSLNLNLNRKRIRNRSRKALSSILSSLTLFVYACSACSVQAAETWENLDRQLKTRVYQLNVAMKLKVGTSLWAQPADLSPKLKYIVFSTSAQDQGYRVVGSGTTFPVKSSNGATFFITNRHVVDPAEPLTQECERFFAAMRLYAEQTSSVRDAGQRFQDLVGIVNLCTKKDLNMAERSVYQETVDGIWDTYDTYLSVKADPSRQVFNKYAQLNAVSANVGYFLHPPGPVSQQALTATMVKVAKGDAEPDLAVLSVKGSHAASLEFDPISPTEGQEIQVIGYPTASDQLDADSSQYYAPTFTTGRISRVAPHTLQVDAPISKGNSGGPVVSLRGKVVGVVARRAVSGQGAELTNFGAAIPVTLVESFLEGVSTR